MLMLKMRKKLDRVIKYLAQGYTASGGTGIWFRYLREYTNCEYIPLQKKYL